jgi:hypothetical protein
MSTPRSIWSLWPPPVRWSAASPAFSRPWSTCSSCWSATRCPSAAAGSESRCVPQARCVGVRREPRWLACHYLGRNERLVGKQRSAPEEWAAHNPAPVWRSGRLDEPIDDVICQRGQFSLIQTARGRGWAASTDVSTNAFQRDGHDLVAGCDAFTWS